MYQGEECDISYVEQVAPLASLLFYSFILKTQLWILQWCFELNANAS